MEDLKQQIIEKLTAELPPEFVLNDTSLWKVDGWNWNGIAIEVAPHSTGRWGWRDSKDAFDITISRVPRSGDSDLPRKVFTCYARDWETETAKAIVFAKKRLVKVIELRKLEREAQQRVDEYNKRLAEAIAAANLPKDCYEESDRLYLVTRLTNDGLFIDVNDDLKLTAEEAAELFAIVGGTLKVTVSRPLTPEQWIAYKRWKKQLAQSE